MRIVCHRLLYSRFILIKWESSGALPFNYWLQWLQKLEPIIL